MKQKKKITKNRFLLGFTTIAFLSALIRLLFPSIAHDRMKTLSKVDSDSTHVMEKVDSAKVKAQSTPSNVRMSHFFTSDGSQKKNRVVGIRGYEESFPDLQPQQLEAALRYGVKPVADRTDAEKRKSELMYVGSNPYYSMKELNSSIPYLVPRAAILLQNITHNFMDNLQTKRVPINKLLASSVLRTKGDVEKSRRHNHDATKNSCHPYSTTFGITYNKYVSVIRPVTNDTLKRVLSKVPNDLRSQRRCFTKHEKHQGCFHTTVRQFSIESCQILKCSHRKKP